MCSRLPVPQPDGLPFHDASYLYTSTFHWKTLVNGYSGYYPPPTFGGYPPRHLPSPAALDQIRDDNVRYVVHEQRYRDPAEAGHVELTLIRLGARRWPHETVQLATLIGDAGGSSTCRSLIRRSA